MPALSIATRGIIKPCCGDAGPSKYTGFIRKEEEMIKPKIDILKVSFKGGRSINENDFMKIQVTEAKFIDRIKE